MNDSNERVFVSNETYWKNKSAKQKKIMIILFGSYYFYYWHFLFFKSKTDGTSLYKS